MLLGTCAVAILPSRHAGAQPAVEDVQVVDLNWIDTARGRSVPVRLYWPATAARTRPVPLIVFSHGLGGTREGYSYLGRAWSARGYASLHVQHAGSDSAVWLGSPLTLFDRVDAAVQEKEAIARALDLRFALDQILDPGKSPVRGLIDRRRIVAAGHSYGANTILIVSGAQVVRNGHRVGYRDPRFQAGIAISAPPFFGETDLRAVLATVAVPTLHVTATADLITLPGRTSGIQDRLDIFNAIRTPRKALAVFEGGSHSIFTDRPWTGGATLNPQVKAATADLSLAFLDLTFRGDANPLVDWNIRWKPIMAATPMPFRTPQLPRERAQL